ncbi:phospholipase D-like domain-containing protein [Couchioplanes caeruleus]|uniref:phospholipase D-like domain-containing protein n=1 Tax=Couchioplanes caeruleus TaxID=56438 RepID=UPI0020BE7CA6|nr:phospholipase D-like domain-containing protein [Couchioplanes caeruleus]UQU67742.1 phospholipase D-like domain-containing protein [Couchioplanes caeruleus]
MGEAAAADAPLEDLVGRYLSRAVPVHREDSTAEVIVDGRPWMLRMRELIRSTGPGDAVYICGLQLDHDMDLTGLAPGDPDHEPLGELLAASAARGVDVRVVLAGAVVASSLVHVRMGPFRDNVRTAYRLRHWRPATAPAAPPPLRGRVLLDWSGSGLGSNHQKMTVVRRGAEITAALGGIDYVASRIDEAPHRRLSVRGGRWGWHDAGAILHGPAAADVWRVFRVRWANSAALPRRRFLRAPRSLPLLNPAAIDAGVPPAAPQPVRPAPGIAVQILRSVGPWYVDSLLPWARRHYASVPPGGVQEAYLTLVQAIGAARRYVYIEDQYFREYPGGDDRFGLYPHLRAAAARGVKIILVGSGTRDPAERGRPINRVLTKDLQRRVIDPLPQSLRRTVGLWRVEHLTVHAKVVLVDDRFAAVGSANFFSRSMAGVDTELTVALVTNGPAVRDLRVRLWAEHLRTPVDDPATRAALEDLDLALGAFRPEWLPPHAPAGTWRRPGMPAGFAPQESVLTLVGPP